MMISAFSMQSTALRSEYAKLHEGPSGLASVRRSSSIEHLEQIRTRVEASDASIGMESDAAPTHRNLYGPRSD